MGNRIHIGALLLLCALTNVSVAGVVDGTAGEKRAKDQLAGKLLKLGQSLDMKESKYPESAGGGGKDYDSNTGNSFMSLTTYHSAVWDTCQEWVGGQYCNKWLPRFVSPHGNAPDFSPLEGLVYKEWKKRERLDAGNQFAIWTIDRGGSAGGKNTDVDGKLDLTGATDWRLRPEVTRGVADIGEKTAVRQISLTYDDSTGKGENTMPNMESLRYMASRWTKMYRNRMVANLGEMRAADKPIEFALSEETPDCEAYMAQMRVRQEETGIEERFQDQGRLDPETRAADLRRRYQGCVAMRNASVYMVGAKLNGNKAEEGSAEEETVDKWRSRLNIALIDRVGINPNELPKPGNVALQKREYSNLIPEHEVGGQSLRGVRMMSNADQLQSYNDTLEKAAIGMKEVAMRSGNVVDNSDHIRGFKIQRGTMNMVELNSLTGEMRGELKETQISRTPAMDPQSGKSPEKNLEILPSQLTVKAIK